MSSHNSTHNNTDNTCVESDEQKSKLALNLSKCWFFKVKVKFDSLPQRIPAFGLLMSFISVFFFSMQSVIVNLLTDLHSIEILVIRSIFQFIVYFIIALVNRHSILGESGQRLYIALRAMTGTISITTIYTAYRLMPIADASTIHFASPVFVAVFGYFLLKEKLTVIQMVTGIITLIGVVIIAKPEFIFGSESEIVHEHRIEGTILAVTACISGALVQISLRKLVKTPVSIVCVWFSLSIVISGLIILIIIDELVWPKGLDTFLLLFSIGVCSVGDQFFFTLAFKHENAGPVSVVRTFNIALVFIWEILIFSTVVEWTSAVGASIVFSCIIIITVFKWKNENSSQLQNMSIFNKIFCRKNTSNYNIEKTSIETFSQNIQ